MKRVLTALAAASLAIAAILLLESFWLFWLALALFWGCAVEYLRLGRRIHPELPRALLLIAMPLVAVAWVVSGPAPAAPPLLLLALMPLVFGVCLLFSHGASPATAAWALGWLSFGLPYLVLPVWALYEIHRASAWLLLALLIGVWANDSFAFWVGSRLGKRKLAPRLSPKKTWEGAIGGLLGGTLAGGAALWWLEGEPRWGVWGLLVVGLVAAQLGDLVESMLKRAAAVKDSGSILPGHGGLLDRLDAIILAAPVFYALLEATGLAAAL